MLCPRALFRLSISAVSAIMLTTVTLLYAVAEAKRNKKAAPSEAKTLLGAIAQSDEGTVAGVTISQSGTLRAASPFLSIFPDSGT